ncbi:MAG: hypothetical protein ABSD49_04745 [Candidatus Bathyarchaeia archaeon]|jgi:hypothetical protein
MANEAVKQNKVRQRRFFSRRLVVPLFLLFLVIWVPVFAVVQIQNIEPPITYVRQDYSLPLIDQYGANFGTLIMNCFDLPLFLSAFMMYH